MERCVEVFVAADATGGFVAAGDEVFLYFDGFGDWEEGENSGGSSPPIRLEVIIMPLCFFARCGGFFWRKNK